MTRKVAVAIVHGVGMPTPDYADGFVKKVRARLQKDAKAAGAPVPEIEFEPVFWSDVIQARQDELWNRVSGKAKLDYRRMRQFILNYAADTIAYQRTPSHRESYEEIHARVAGSFKRLAERAGPDAPLCVVAHSLGSVIASDYLFNLETEFREPRTDFLSERVAKALGPNPSPLERGETLSLLYTLGSPIAIWSLRHQHADPARDYGTPVTVPSGHLSRYHAALGAPGPGSGWYNLYDPGDVIAYPLQGLNETYAKAVRDVRVEVGGLVTGMTPASHVMYWTAPPVVDAVAQGLRAAWDAVNPREVPVGDAAPAAPKPRAARSKK